VSQCTAEILKHSFTARTAPYSSRTIAHNCARGDTSLRPLLSAGSSLSARPQTSFWTMRHSRSLGAQTGPPLLPPQTVSRERAQLLLLPPADYALNLFAECAPFTLSSRTHRRTHTQTHRAALSCGRAINPRGPQTVSRGPQTVSRKPSLSKQGP